MVLKVFYCSALVVGATAAADAGWHTEVGMNACTNGNCGEHKDQPGLHFAGLKPNVTACAATCEAAAPKDCGIWLYSSGSQSCWWRTDSVWQLMAQADVTSACREDVGSDGTPCIVGCGSCGAAPTPPPTPLAPSTQDNMNGDYVLSQTPQAAGTAAKFPQNMRDYPKEGGGDMYSFDVISPVVSQLYSQVFWTGLAPVDLPAHIVARFAGKGMVVTAFEMDQVLVDAETGEQTPVPINYVYNHHFESNMIGANAHYEREMFDGPDAAEKLAALEAESPHGIPDVSNGHWMHVEDRKSAQGLPSKMAFGGGNGGEYRMSFHGYAPGFGQIIESPRQMQITPMQIDTWNRDKMSFNASGGTPFVPGPLPRNSLAPTENPLYSGLLECPVSTRLHKEIDADYNLVGSAADTCAGPLATASECFAGAAKALVGASPRITTASGADGAHPAGCSITSDPVTGAARVFFNKPAATDAPPACGAGSASLAGRTATAGLVDVHVSLDAAAAVATITLAGPSDVWFGVGFNASSMRDLPWAVIVDGAGNVEERKIVDQVGGSVLPRSVTVTSVAAANGTRTVTLTRPFAGKTEDYYSFGASATHVLSFINAVGSQPTFSIHKSKGPASLALLPTTGAGACLCATAPKPFGEQKGKLTYVPTSQKEDTGGGTVGCCNTCSPEPRSDMLAMKNPTCDIRTYTGGQIACHHMWSLLDADQEIPWADQPIEYHIKYRFWVQEYVRSPLARG